MAKNPKMPYHDPIPPVGVSLGDGLMAPVSSESRMAPELLCVTVQRQLVPENNYFQPIFA